MISGERAGWSHSATSTASRPGSAPSSAESPSRIDEAMPDGHAGLNAVETGRWAMAARTLSASAPTTATTGRAGDPRTASTTRATSGLPSNSTSCFEAPMRDEPPAARTRAPSRSGSRAAGSLSGMDREGALAQRPAVAPGQDSHHLRHDAQGDLVGPLATQVEAHRRVQAREHLRRRGESLRRELGQNPLRPGPGPEHSKVGKGKRQELAQ